LAHIGGADKPGDASVSSIVEVIKREGRWRPRRQAHRGRGH